MSSPSESRWSNASLTSRQRASAYAREWGCVGTTNASPRDAVERETSDERRVHSPLHQPRRLLRRLDGSTEMLGSKAAGVPELRRHDARAEHADPNVGSQLPAHHVGHPEDRVLRRAVHTRAQVGHAEAVLRPGVQQPPVARQAQYLTEHRTAVPHAPDIHREDPFHVGGLQAHDRPTHAVDPRVVAHQAGCAELVDDVLRKRGDLDVGRHVTRERRHARVGACKLLRECLSALTVDVDDGYRGCAARDGLSYERGADARTATGDDHDLPRDLHEPCLLRNCARLEALVRCGDRCRRRRPSPGR